MKKKILKAAFSTMLASCALVSLPACKKSKPKDPDPIVDPTTIDITGVTLNSQEFVYDGTAKTIEVSGTIPSGVSVSYAYKNSSSEVVTSCIEAGTYTVTATLSGTGYNTLTLTTTITIKAKELITGVILEASEVDYDGTAKTIQVTGTIPTGCSVSYSYKKGDAAVNECVDAGEYTVTATVTGDGYEDLVLTAVLTIKKVPIAGLTFDEQTVLYTGTNQAYTLPTSTDYSAEVEGYYSDESLLNKVTDVKTTGEYFVKISVTKDNYLPTVYVSKLTIIKNENSAHDVTVVYSEGTEIYSKTYVVESKEILTYADIKDYLDTLPDPGTDYDYYWVNYNGEEITSDLTISINKQAISYEIRFVDTNGELLTSTRLLPESDLFFPTIKIGDNYVLTWEYEGKKYFTGSGLTYTDTEDKVVVACDLMSEEENNLYDYSLEDGYFAITKYNGDEENVVLPTLAFKLYLGELTVYNVTRVMQLAFRDKNTIKTIVIPSCYTTFDDYAFAGVYNLMSITLPATTSKTSVGNGVFAGDTRLLEYVYVDSINPVTSEFPYGGINNFALFSRNISDESNIKIESDCVYYINNNTTYLYEYLNSNNVSTLTLPTTLGGKNYTILEFAINDSFDKIIIPNNTVLDCTLMEYSFIELVIGDNVTFNNPEEVFAGCENLTTVTLGDGITTLYAWMFAGCTNLATLNIKDVITSVEDGALFDCSNVVINFAHSESEINPTVSEEDNTDYQNATKNYNVSI